MTVAELMNMLRAMPQDMEVRIEGEVCAAHVDSVEHVHADPTPRRDGGYRDYVVIYPGDFKP